MALFGGVVIVILILIAIFGGPIAAAVTGHPNTRPTPSTMQDEFGIPLGPEQRLLVRRRRRPAATSSCARCTARARR